MKLSRFGIYTCGRVCAFIASWGMLRAYPASVRITITTVVKLRIGIFTSPHTEPREAHCLTALQQAFRVVQATLAKRDITSSLP